MHKKEYIFTIKARYILDVCGEGRSLVLNVPWPDEDLPAPFRRLVGEKKLKVFAIEAASVAKSTGMGKLINNIMLPSSSSSLVCFPTQGPLPPQGRSQEDLQEQGRQRR